ncbi:hypothetical protein PVAP13_7NG440000 [Panicum virgatum]|uniref:Uncharacterized protein n=1 Tax=Panicum virgatum TaxID=38727 RepID=A0A8T0QGC1_PANVG|nr:hypothetical protein PVAP13_7NG440000 [Panicum virgatum]
MGRRHRRASPALASPPLPPSTKMLRRRGPPAAAGATVPRLLLQLWSGGAPFRPGATASGDATFRPGAVAELDSCNMMACSGRGAPAIRGWQEPAACAPRGTRAGVQGSRRPTVLRQHRPWLLSEKKRGHRRRERKMRTRIGSNPLCWIV